MLMILTYDASAIQSSFFTWVAQKVNPLFDLIFPEAYHPERPTTTKLPKITRPTPTRDIADEIYLPIFYIDRNKTVRGLLRRFGKAEDAIAFGSNENDETKTFHNFRAILNRDVARRPPRTAVNESCDACLGNFDKYLFTPERVSCHGYSTETHKVYTNDGYILIVFRIKPLEVSMRFRKPVILQHGLLGSSDDWLMLGKEKSLAYKLVNAGYDVWLPNARGNIYSRGHKTMSSNYWNFSWQEIGQYDLASVIDYIIPIVKKESHHTAVFISYIGHSMGASALLALLSTNPRYNSHIRLAILLAPLAFMDDSIVNLEKIVQFSAKYPKNMAEILGNGLTDPSKHLPSWWIDNLDHQCVGGSAMCANPLFFIAGPVFGQWDECLKADVLNHLPSGGSINTIAHYAQCAKNNGFQQFNGSEFRLDQITVPIAIFSSSSDALATEHNVEKLYFKLVNPISYLVIRSRRFSHTEFVWGLLANRFVYTQVVRMLGGKTWPKVNYEL